MKAKDIIFLYYPCMVVVCEQNSIDRETNDLREYAKIVLHSYEIPTFRLSDFDFVPAGTIKWTKHAYMLTEEQRKQIQDVSIKTREDDKERIEHFTRLKEASLRKHNKED